MTLPRTILITGASRGIGAALAEGFAGLGWNLVLTDSYITGQNLFVNGGHFMQ